MCLGCKEIKKRNLQFYDLFDENEFRRPYQLLPHFRMLQNRILAKSKDGGKKDKTRLVFIG